MFDPIEFDRITTDPSNESIPILLFEVITSPSNPRVKRAQSLRETRGRKREQRMIIDGAGLIQQAIKAGIECEELFLAHSPELEFGSDPCNDPHVRELRQLAERCPKTRVNLLGAEAMAKIQYGDRQVTAIAIAKIPDMRLECRLQSLRLDTRGIFLVLDRIEKPGNLGAILRSADAAGVKAVLVSDPVSDVWNPNAIRSSLGAIFCVPFAVGTAEEIEQWLLTRQIALFAARADGGVDYASLAYPSRVALVIGSEAFGLESRWSGRNVTSIHIPMQGAIDSLNASISAAILLFEVVRQARRSGEASSLRGNGDSGTL